MYTEYEANAEYARTFEELPEFPELETSIPLDLLLWPAPPHLLRANYDAANLIYPFSGDDIAREKRARGES